MDGEEKPKIKLLNSNGKSPFSVLFDRQLGRSNRQSSLSVNIKHTAEDFLVNKEEFDDDRCLLPPSARSTFLIVFSPDGKLVASTHGDHSIYVCEVASGKCIRTLVGHPRTPWCLAFHPTSSQLLASGCLGGQVRVWDLSGGSEVWCAEEQTVIASLAFHPSSERLLVIATYNELLFWDWSTQRPFAKCTTKCDKEKVRYVSFDPLGVKLITGIANRWATTSQWDQTSTTATPPQRPVNTDEEGAFLDLEEDRHMANYRAHYQYFRNLENLRRSANSTGNVPQYWEVRFSNLLNEYENLVQRCRQRIMPRNNRPLQRVDRGTNTQDSPPRPGGSSDDQNPTDDGSLLDLTTTRNTTPPTTEASASTFTASVSNAAGSSETATGPSSGSPFRIQAAAFKASLNALRKKIVLSRGNIGSSSNVSVPLNEDGQTDAVPSTSNPSSSEVLQRDSSVPRQIVKKRKKSNTSKKEASPKNFKQKNESTVKESRKNSNKINSSSEDSAVKESRKNANKRKYASVVDSDVKGSRKNDSKRNSDSGHSTASESAKSEKKKSFKDEDKSKGGKKRKSESKKLKKKRKKRRKSDNNDDSNIAPPLATNIYDNPQPGPSTVPEHDNSYIIFSDTSDSDEFSSDTNVLSPGARTREYTADMPPRTEYIPVVRPERDYSADMPPRTEYIPVVRPERDYSADTPPIGFTTLRSAFSAANPSGARMPPQSSASDLFPGSFSLPERTRSTALPSIRLPTGTTSTLTSSFSGSSSSRNTNPSQRRPTVPRFLRPCNELAVRYATRMLIKQIDLMERRYRARLEVLQLEQIRRLWEEFMTQLSSFNSTMMNTSSRNNQGNEQAAEVENSGSTGDIPTPALNLNEGATPSSSARINSFRFETDPSDEYNGTLIRISHLAVLRRLVNLLDSSDDNVEYPSVEEIQQELDVAAVNLYRNRQDSSATPSSDQNQGERERDFSERTSPTEFLEELRSIQRSVVQRYDHTSLQQPSEEVMQQDLDRILHLESAIRERLRLTEDSIEQNSTTGEGSTSSSSLFHRGVSRSNLSTAAEIAMTNYETFMGPSARSSMASYPTTPEGYYHEMQRNSNIFQQTRRQAWRVLGLMVRHVRQHIELHQLERFSEGSVVHSHLQQLLSLLHRALDLTDTILTHMLASRRDLEARWRGSVLTGIISPSISNQLPSTITIPLPTRPQASGDAHRSVQSAFAQLDNQLASAQDNDELASEQSDRSSAPRQTTPQRSNDVAEESANLYSDHTIQLRQRLGSLFTCRRNHSARQIATEEQHGEEERVRDRAPRVSHVSFLSRCTCPENQNESGNNCECWRRSLERLERIQSSSNNSIRIRGLSGNITDVNRRVERITHMLHRMSQRSRRMLTTVPGRNTSSSNSRRFRCRHNPSPRTAQPSANNSAPTSNDNPSTIRNRRLIGILQRLIELDPSPQLVHWAENIRLFLSPDRRLSTSVLSSVSIPALRVNDVPTGISEPAAAAAPTPADSSSSRRETRPPSPTSPPPALRFPFGPPPLVQISEISDARRDRQGFQVNVGIRSPSRSPPWVYYPRNRNPVGTMPRAYFSNQASMESNRFCSIACPTTITHRIQCWPFDRDLPPDISDSRAYIVVANCRINNDASVDISNDGRVIVALIPPHITGGMGKLGVYSLDYINLGQCLFTTYLEQSPVSVSFSPSTKYLLVGLAARRFLTVRGDSSPAGQIFRLPWEKIENCKGKKNNKEYYIFNLNPVRLIYKASETGFVSINCFRWAPVSGQGMVYGTNTGQLGFLR